MFIKRLQGEILNRHFYQTGIKFPDAVRLVLSLPAECNSSTISSIYPYLNVYLHNSLLESFIQGGPDAKNIMRQCCLDAGLINRKFILSLEFITERE
jgi:hypothetical protein